MINPPILQKTVRSASLLIVEDKDDHWQSIQLAFRQAAPAVALMRVSSGEQAYAYLTTCLQQVQPLPDLVLLDLYLPAREQGWQVLAAIRDHGAPLDQLSVLVLSHSSLMDDIVSSYQKGARAYLVKPVLPTDWAELIARLRAYWLDTVTLPIARPSF